MVMQDGVMQWHPGRNNPLVYRGRGGQVCDQARLLVANLLWNVRQNAAVFANAMPALGGKQGWNVRQNAAVFANAMPARGAAMTSPFYTCCSVA